MADKLFSEYQYINKSGKLLICIVRVLDNWSYVVRSYPSHEILLDATEDVIFFSTKKQCKNVVEQYYGSITPLSTFLSKNRKSSFYVGRF